MYANTDITVNGLVQILKKKGMFARSEKPFANGSIAHILKSRKYIGEYRWGDVNNNCIPPIVDKYLFEKVQKKLKDNVRDCQKFQATEDYVLTRKFFCGDCSSQMIGESYQKKNGKIYRYYKCSKRKHGKECKMSAIGKDIIEDYVCYQTFEFLSNEVNTDKLSLAIHDYQESKSPMVQNIEARTGETTK